MWGLRTSRGNKEREIKRSCVMVAFMCMLKANKEEAARDSKLEFSFSLLKKSSLSNLFLSPFLFTFWFRHCVRFPVNFIFYVLLAARVLWVCQILCYGWESHSISFEESSQVANGFYFNIRDSITARWESSWWELMREILQCSFEGDVWRLFAMHVTIAGSAKRFLIVFWRYQIPGIPHNNDKNKVINPKPYANMRTDKMCLATKNFINELGKELNVTNTCCLLECQERILRDSL